MANGASCVQCSFLRFRRSSSSDAETRRVAARTTAAKRTGGTDAIRLKVEVPARSAEMSTGRSLKCCSTH